MTALTHKKDAPKPEHFLLVVVELKMHIAPDEEFTRDQEFHCSNSPFDGCSVFPLN